MKLKLIYYKNILDLAIENFISGYEDFFCKEKSKYVFGLSISKEKLQKVLEKCIDISIDDVVKKCCKKDDVLLIIGSCYPKDNLLFRFKNECYFPKKLASIIEQKPALKWLLVEQDIDIDIELFNELLVSIFNKHFCKKDPKRSNVQRPSILFIAHSKLDCYMVFKTIKWAYGNSNCYNVWKEDFKCKRQNFIALNDMISKYIHNKSRINKSKEFKTYALEMKDYIDRKLGIT